jgi:hypothetical protein
MTHHMINAKGGIRLIRAGSTVKHVPTGENWYLLGVSKVKNKVCIAGYPPTIAQLDDCIEIEEGQGLAKRKRNIETKNLGRIGIKGGRYQ